jgi:2,4-dienoyl-CoA reductase-like NADH-dependent reductase (Old Yellow Enzyme family)
MLGIDTDQHISKYRELVNHVHQNGAKIAMQINHCGRQTTKEMTGTQPKHMAFKDGYRYIGNDIQIRLITCREFYL